MSYGSHLLNTGAVAMQEGFLAQDDAGAHDAYERELDEEEDIRRMEAEAAARRAEGAAHANGASLSAAPAQDAAGEPSLCFPLITYS